MAIGEVAATTAAIAVINKAAPALVTQMADAMGQKLTEVRARFLKNFQTHLSKSLQKSRHVKTVVSKDKPVLLEKIYVPLTLHHDDDDYIEDKFLNPTSRPGRRIIVSGTGGAGKTILMKHLLNIASENQAGIIPLFFELRSLKLDTFHELESALYFELVREGGEESEDLFVACLNEGAIAIFLDGFDEVHPDRIIDTLRAIETFGRKFPKASIIASTRPGTGLQDLQDFDVFHVNPLDKDQTISVVEKTKFDKESKDNFIKALKSGLYEKHQTMMSIPILVVMMLLTFRSYGDIPDRMTVFYGQAFDTLFSIHDSENKTQYKRTYLSGLAPDQFKQVLESFCYRSLAQHELEFTQTTLDSYISDSIKFEKVDVAAKDFQSDLVKNVCILQPDGITFVFVHRSFQEYFGARFALRYSGERQYDVIDRIVQGRGGGVARMLDEMNRPKLYREWLLPRLKDYQNQLQALLPRPSWEKMNAFFREITFYKGRFDSGMGGSRFGWTQGYEVLRSVTEQNISFASIVSDLVLDVPPIEELEAEGSPWAEFVTYDNDEEEGEEPRLVLAVPMVEASARLLERLNVDVAISGLADRLEQEIVRVERYVANQAKLEDALLA